MLKDFIGDKEHLYRGRGGAAMEVAVFQWSHKGITESGYLKMGKGEKGESVCSRMRQRQGSRTAQVFGMEWERFLSDQDEGLWGRRVEI